MKSISNFLLFTFFIILSGCSTTPNNPGVGSQGQQTGLLSQEETSQNTEDGNEVSVLSADGRYSKSGEALEGQSPEEMALNAVESEDTFEPVVYFEYDEFVLSESNTNIVRFYAMQMLDDLSLKVVLKGHTDERGSPEYNIALGEKRGKAVEQAMMLFGIGSDRIEVISFGEEQPAVTESNENAWQKNRRVEIDIR